MTKAKRRGRPFKEPTAGKRAPLSLLVRPEIKQLVDERAKASGRTQSQEAEMMIERCLTYDQTMTAMGTTLAEMERGNVDAAMRRQGYTPMHSPHGTIWVPPGHPAAPPPSGFIPDKEAGQ